MDSKEQKILEDILESKGDCLHWEKCGRCPFASKCLSKMTQEPKSMLSKKERLNLALERLSNLILLDDDTTRLDHEDTI